MIRALGVAATASAVVFWAPAAAASPPFPDEIKSHLGASSAPQCAVCHEGGKTGVGTVTTLFGKALRDRGLVAQDTASLDAALDQLDKDGVDSDGDGTPDIEELKNGTDPNQEGGAVINQPDPVYGCTANVASGGPGRAGPGAALLLAAIAALGARRRRSARVRAGALLVAASAASLLLMGCYETSYVSSDVCATGLLWTGGDTESPLMHPGRACVECHARDEGPRFEFAGTVFPDPGMADDCFGTKDAVILVTGADGKSIKMTPNEAGNFYTKLTVQMPYTAEVLSGGKGKIMATPQSSGDCNGCHTEKGQNAAPGRITLP